MPRSLRSLTLITAGLLLVALSVLTPTRRAEAQVDLIVSVIDTIASAGAQNTPISIFLDNFSDSVAGVEFWVQLDRPDVIVFQTDIDTVDDTTLWNCLTGTWPACSDSEQVFDTILYWNITCKEGEVWPACTDSIQVVDPSSGFDFATLVPYDFMAVETGVEIITGNFDTTNTLLSGWEFVDSRSLGQNGFDLKVTALANQASAPYTPGIGFPQTGGTMVKLLADVILDDTATDRTVNIRIIVSSLDNFSFSDEEGNSIGIITDSVLDSTLWFCVETDAGTGVCVNYIQVSTPPFDSVSTRWVLVGSLDTTAVLIFDGSLTVLLPPDCVCGDSDENQRVNIGDVTYMVAHIFTGGQGPQCGGPNDWPGDSDGNCRLNIADVTYLVAHIFLGGPGPAGCCATGP